MLKSLKIFIIPLILTLSYAVRAQENYQDLENRLEFDPTRVYPQTARAKTVKQMVILKNGYDTISVERFDGQGRKVYAKGFSYGKPESITTFVSSNDGKSWSWRSSRLKDKTVWTSKTTYLSPGVPLQFYNMDYNAKGDTTVSQRAVFSYDPQGKLLQRKDFTAGRLSLQKDYRYRDRLLIEMVSQLKGSGSKRRMEYRYDENGRLAESKEFNVRPQETTLMKTIQYVWKDSNVVEKIYKNETAPKRTYNFLYTYDAKGRLSTYDAKLDSNFKQAQFLYEGDRLKEIVMRFNSKEPFPDALSVWHAEPFKDIMVYRKVFSYDERADLARMEEFYGTRLDSAWNYEFTY